MTCDPVIIPKTSCGGAIVGSVNEADPSIAWGAAERFHLRYCSGKCVINSEILFHTCKPFITLRTVPGEHRASVLTGAPTSTDEDVAPFTARTGLSSMTPTYRDLEADSTRNAKSIAREGKTGDAGRTNTNSVTADPTWKTEAGARSEQKLDRACACSRASSSRDAEPSSASAVALPGDVEAPGYDAAVNPPPCVSSGREVDDMLTAEGGEVDEDSSDGGAAYEEISAWLHSTDDWWIS